jgi:hypothetical protein
MTTAVASAHSSGVASAVAPANILGVTTAAAVAFAHNSGVTTAAAVAFANGLGVTAAMASAHFFGMAAAAAVTSANSSGVAAAVTPAHVFGVTTTTAVAFAASSAVAATMFAADGLVVAFRAPAPHVVATSAIFTDVSAATGENGNASMPASHVAVARQFAPVVAVGTANFSG